MMQPSAGRYTELGKALARIDAAMDHIVTAGAIADFDDGNP